MIELIYVIIGAAFGFFLAPYIMPLISHSKIVVSVGTYVLALIMGIGAFVVSVIFRIGIQKVIARRKKNG